MVSTGSDYNFTAVIDDFFALKHVSGTHGDALKAMVRARASTLLAHPDVRYMPAFKILDLLAALVNLAAAVAQAPQLRANEARALLRESLSDTAPLIHHFMLEAALERVRYEPLMLATRSDAASERETLLQLRWAAMRAAHQEKATLPDAWMDSIDSAVERVLAAHTFRHFRQGPLLQFFAEMLSLGRKLHQQHAPLDQLTAALSEHGALWKRYALKTSRFTEHPPLPAPTTYPLVPSHSIH
ncbi:MAG: hypothetical protein V4735_01900 [Pseudomonadota bacterium]